MSLLLEAIRIENYRAENIRFHQYRMDHAARQLWNTDAPDIAGLLDLQLLPGPGIFKCSIRYDQHHIEAAFSAYILRPVFSIKLIRADSLDYGLKYADRSAIDALFAQRGKADDVLFIKHGLITDTSYANVALLKGNQWFTPALPLLKGTMRHYLLENGVLKEADIRPDEIQEYSTLRLINAMMPWGTGVEIQCADVKM